MPQGLVSVENSTHDDDGNLVFSPLGFATTFAGTFVPAKYWGSVQLSVLSDAASIADGLKFIWSDDGITDHVTDDTRTYSLIDDQGVAITSAYTFNLDKRGNFFRVEFVKSALDNQTVFRLITTFHEEAPWPLKLKRFNRRLQDNDLGAMVTAQVTRYSRNQIRTAVPLIANDSFVFGDVSMRDQQMVTINLFADQDSAPNGLVIRFSDDNANYDHTLYYTYDASAPIRPIRIPVLGRAVQVTYTNGPIAQGVFRLNIVTTAAPETGVYSLGHPSDPAWSGSGDGNVTQVLKRLVSGAASEVEGTGVLTNPFDFVEIDVTGMATLNVQFLGSMSAGSLQFVTSHDWGSGDSSVVSSIVTLGGVVLTDILLANYFDGIAVVIPCAGMESVRVYCGSGFVGPVTVDWATSPLAAAVYVANQLRVQGITGGEPVVVTGALTSGGAVTIADGADVAEGAKADAAASSDAGTFSLIALVKRLLGKFTTQFPATLVSGRLDVNIGASSATVPVSGTVSVTEPVSVDDNGGSLTVDAASLPLPTGASTEATLALIKAKTDNIDVALSTRTKPADTQAISAALLPLPAGAATEATLATRLTESDFDSKTGSLTETAPATDTASSGLNGRLQRIAQRLTSLIALLPSALVGGRLDVNIGASSATVPVSGTVSVTQPVAVTDNAGSLTVDTPQLPAALVGGRLDVNIGAGGGGAVTIADGADVTQGAKADVAATTDAGMFSFIALFKRLLEKLATAAMGDSQANPTIAKIQSYLMCYQPGDGTWSRVRDGNSATSRGMLMVCPSESQGAVDGATTMSTLNNGLGGVKPLWVTGGAFVGTSFNMLRDPAVFKTASATASGNTAVWTPMAGKKYRMMRYMITVTGNATLAAAGVLTVALFDTTAGLTGQSHSIFVPAIALNNSGTLYTTGWIDLGNGFLSPTADNVFNINLSAALLTGVVRIICAGTEEL